MKPDLELPLAFVLIGFEKEDLNAISEFERRGYLLLTMAGEDIAVLLAKPGRGRLERLNAPGMSKVVVRRRGVDLTLKQKALLAEALGQYSDKEAAPEALVATLSGYEDSVLRGIADASMRSLADANLALASLRIEHERLQILFSHLESALYNKHAVPAVFQNPPMDEWFAPSAATGISLRQLLPVVGAFLGTITLFFRPSPDGSRGALRVRLISAETDEELAVWLVQYDEIHEGAADFVCSRVLPADIGRVRLDLEWITTYGSPPSIRLANAEAWRAGQCRAGASVLHGRMLALKMAAGAASISSVRSPYVEWAKGNGLTLIGLDLTPAVLGGVRAITTGDTFVPVEVVEEAPYVQLHPPRDGVTAAIVENCVPTGTHHVSAAVRVDAVDCGDVEFAIDVFVPDGPSETAVESAVLARVERLQWTPVAGGTSTLIAVDLSTATSAAGHLVIATRMAIPGNNDFGWARWNGFTARVAAFRELSHAGGVA